MTASPGAGGTPTPTGADPAEFRAAMGRWATGVSVVTAHHQGQDFGLTVNAFLSVSLRPPLVLISLTHEADTTPMIEASGRFAVNVLAADQQTLSDRFARTIPAAEKFDGLDVARGRHELPLLTGALVHLECAVRSSQTIEDHRLFLGHVERIGTARDAPPLIFFRGGYAEPGSDQRLSLPGGPR